MWLTPFSFWSPGKIQWKKDLLTETLNSRVSLWGIQLPSLLTFHLFQVFTDETESFKPIALLEINFTFCPQLILKQVFWSKQCSVKVYWHYMIALMKFENLQQLTLSQVNILEFNTKFNFEQPYFYIAFDFKWFHYFYTNKSN